MRDEDLTGELSEILLSEEQIQARIRELAARIDTDYADKDLLLIAVLKGALMIMADLSRALNRQVEIDFMAVSSYGTSTQSSGVVKIIKDLDADIQGRHVLIVEDIIDSGLTLSWLLENLRSRGPASLEVCALLRKQTTTGSTLEVKYHGFDIPDAFVVGYGLDYAEKYRNLRSVAILAPQVYS